jgi:hypothetical protein
MVQLVVLLQFYFYGLCSFFFNCSGKLYSSPSKKFRDLVRRSKFASMSETSQIRKMSADSKQWLNGYDYTAINCDGTVQAYFSSSFGYCAQNNYTSSYIISDVSLSNGNVSYTDTEYNTNSQCSGSPSQVVTGTFPQCIAPNETGPSWASYGFYSITNSIPPLPAGLLYRYSV